MLPNKIGNFLNVYLATLLLIIFYLSEAFSKYSIFFLSDKSDIPRAIKFLALIFVVLSILKPIKNIIIPGLLFVFFCVGQLFLENSFNIEIVVSFSKFLFPIFLFIYFNQNFQKAEAKSILFNTFEWLIVFNGILIIIGFLGNIYLFKSYPGPRFGYNGMFITSATSSYVYTLSLFYFLVKLKGKFFRNWMAILTIICCFLIGTKVIYISMFGTLILYLYYFNNLQKQQIKSLTWFLIVLSLGFGYFFFFWWGPFNEIREEEGLLSSILSFRDDLLLQETIPYIQNHWKLPNYLFGGISDLGSRSQMGFIDVFYFWGIAGGLFYLYYFYRSYITFPLWNWLLYLFLILAVVVFLAGNFFENASVAIYLLILKEKLLDFTALPNKHIINE